jgi:integrase
VTGQVVPANPAASVRGPQHIVKGGKTPVLDPAEARALLDSIDTATPAGLRDRALIALMVYSFARVGAALAMKVEDVFVQKRRLWVRLREKGDGDHGISEKRRPARKRRRDGEPRFDAHDAALRSPARRNEPRRGGADFDMSE